MARAERQFVCKLCGHRALALVSAVGEGAQSSLNSRGTAAARAQKDAEANIDRVLAIAECPKCKERDPAAMRAWYFQRILPVILSTAFIAFLGWVPLLFDLNMKESDKPIAGWIMTGIALFVAVPFVFTHVIMGAHTAKHGVKFLEEDVQSDAGVS